ncbi:MAG: Ppx/GppA family phosphatase [Clostridium sp.]
MGKIGVINIGSNSMKLMLFEVEEDGYYKILDELHSNVRFCYDCENNCVISEGLLKKIITDLKTFKQLCSTAGAEKIILTATESFRLEVNKALLTDIIQSVLNLEVNILSYDEEIKYTALGVTKTMDTKNSLLVYVGGIVTHVAKLKDNNLVQYTTLPFGAMDISYTYDLTDRILGNNLTNAINHIEKTLLDIPWLAEERYDSIILSGIMARNLCKIDRIKKRYPLSIEHNYLMDNMDIHDIFNTLKSKDKKQRNLVEGLDYGLGDVILGGTSIIHAIVGLVDCEKSIISSTGLLEGILYDYIINNYDIIDDNLDYSITGILNNLNINKVHAKHVYDLALKLYDKLRPLHKLNNDYLKILKTGAMLHDSGISINYQNHHMNSFYIIMNSALNNLSHRELLLSAGVAASHRFNSYKMPCTPFTSIINKHDLKIVDMIGVIVKIAEGLDRSTISAVNDIEISLDDESVTITALSDRDISMETSQAMRAAHKFKEIFNRDLIIRSV